jgi:hypothetical protein
MKSKEEVKVPQ